MSFTDPQTEHWELNDEQWRKVLKLHHDCTALAISVVAGSRSCWYGSLGSWCSW
jgi:hypothetical protein